MRNHSESFGWIATVNCCMEFNTLCYNCMQPYGEITFKHEPSERNKRKKPTPTNSHLSTDKIIKKIQHTKFGWPFSLSSLYILLVFCAYV